MTAPGHCSICGREWGALGQAHCAGTVTRDGIETPCCEHFNSDTAFDRHRTEDFQCIPVEDFSKPWRKTGKPMLVQTIRASGPTWVTALQSSDDPERKPS